MHNTFEICTFFGQEGEAGAVVERLEAGLQAPEVVLLQGEELREAGQLEEDRGGEGLQHGAVRQEERLQEVALEEEQRMKIQTVYHVNPLSTI